MMIPEMVCPGITQVMWAMGQGGILQVPNQKDFVESALGGHLWV